MAILDVKKIPDPVLRRETQPVEEFDENLQQLIDDMVDTMRDEPGVGLAAPQVGISRKLVVVEFGDEDDPEKPAKLYAVANPEIVEISEEVGTGIEGCLSIGGEVFHIYRAFPLHPAMVGVVMQGVQSSPVAHNRDDGNGLLKVYDKVRLCVDITHRLSDPVKNLGANDRIFGDWDGAGVGGSVGAGQSAVGSVVDVSANQAGHS